MSAVSQAMSCQRRNIKLKISQISKNEILKNEGSDNNWCQLLDELDSEDSDQVQICSDFLNDDPFAQELLPYEIHAIKKCSQFDNSIHNLNDSIVSKSIDLIVPEQVLEIGQYDAMIEPQMVQSEFSSEKPESMISLDESAIIFIRSENQFFNRSCSPNQTQNPYQNSQSQKINTCNLLNCSISQNQQTITYPSSNVHPDLMDAHKTICHDLNSQVEGISPQKLINLSSQQMKQMEQTNNSINIEPLATSTPPLFSLTESKQNQSKDIQSLSNSILSHQKIQISQETRSDPLGSQSTIIIDNEIDQQNQLLHKIPFIQVKSSNHASSTFDSKSSQKHPQYIVTQQQNTSQSTNYSNISLESAYSTQQGSFLSTGRQFLSKFLEFASKPNLRPDTQSNCKQNLKRLFSFSDKDEPTVPIAQLFHSQGITIQNPNRILQEHNKAKEAVVNSKPRNSAPTKQQQINNFPIPKRSSDQCILIGHLQAKLIQSPENQISILSNKQFSQYYSFLNKGKERWPENVHFRCIDGIFENQSFPISSAEASQVSSVTISFQSPVQSGIYTNSFKLCFVNGECELQFFGPKITFNLTVVNP